MVQDQGGPQHHGVRIEGPYQHRSGWRYRVATSAGRSWCASAKTQERALKIAEAVAAKAARQGSITVADALDSYIQHKKRSGVRGVTQANMGNAVRGLFRGVMDSSLSRLTQRVCQAQYEQLQGQVDPRTGKICSVSTHRAYLAQSRGFMRWVVDQGWLAESPLERVRGVGRKRRGKVQLTLDEAHRFSQTCRREAERGDAGALATLLCLHLGLRASEALSRVVRDLDQGGTILRVRDPDAAFLLKTGSSQRAPKIPTFLQPLLSARAAAAGDPTAPLFPGSLGGRRRRQFLWVEVRRLCRKAGVPTVCPHSLRGLFATAAASAGETPELVARILGHTDVAMTLGHYIAPSVAAELRAPN
jgi:integrase